MLEAQDANMKGLAKQQPKAFLEQYALYETVLAAPKRQDWINKARSKSKLPWRAARSWSADMIDETHNEFSRPDRTRQEVL